MMGLLVLDLIAVTWPNVIVFKIQMDNLQRSSRRPKSLVMTKIKAQFKTHGAIEARSQSNSEKYRERHVCDEDFSAIATLGQVTLAATLDLHID